MCYQPYAPKPCRVKVPNNSDLLGLNFAIGQTVKGNIIEVGDLVQVFVDGSKLIQAGADPSYFSSEHEYFIGKCDIVLN